MRGKKGMNLKRVHRKRRREKKKVLGSSKNSKFKVKNQKSKVEKVKINLGKKCSFKKDKSVARSLT